MNLDGNIVVFWRLSVNGQGHKVNSRHCAVTRTSGLGNMLISRYDDKLFSCISQTVKYRTHNVPTDKRNNATSSTPHTHSRTKSLGKITLGTQTFEWTVTYDPIPKACSLAIIYLIFCGHNKTVTKNLFQRRFSPLSLLPFLPLFTAFPSSLPYSVSFSLAVKRTLKSC